MKSLIIVYSYHHNNTTKVAKAMAHVLDAEIKTPDQAKTENLAEYDLVGFGAGIDSGMHYKELLDFAKDISANSQKCFIFSTSAIYSESKMTKDHTKLRDVLKAKQYNVLGEFSCKGFNTNSFLKYFGGMNKNYPTDEDINNANLFAYELLNKA